MQLATGTYIGNGIDNRWIIDPGFQPDLVIIKANAAQYAVFSTSVMPAGKSAVFSSSAAIFSNAIQAFGVNGFQVGTHYTANKDGVAYYWSAFRDDGYGDMDVGSYIGDGTDNRNLDIVGFRPTILWIKSAGGDKAVWRVEEIVDDQEFPREAEFGNVDRHHAVGLGLGEVRDVAHLQVEVMRLAAFAARELVSCWLSSSGSARSNP